jgi:hypothetical protein
VESEVGFLKLMFVTVVLSVKGFYLPYSFERRLPFPYDEKSVIIEVRKEASGGWWVSPRRHGYPLPSGLSFPGF